MNPYPNPSAESIATEQAQESARAEIARNIVRLMAPGNVDPPEHKLPLWEQVGAAVMEYLHAEQALTRTLRRRIATLEAREVPTKAGRHGRR